ncbi:MAG: DNA-binding response regulator [Flaviaesturariibacter sp.]|nr:DNA-binding response regulator [Flaviaesturariibacter sp.]
MKRVFVRRMIGYAAALAALLLLLQWMQYRLLLLDHATEIYITGIALLFTALGIWLAKKLTKARTVVVTETVVVEKEVPVYTSSATFTPDREAIGRLGLSSRELEVLGAIASGATNQEIADLLFLSLNTVKTHTARLFEKLDVRRRTQAVEKGKRLGIIP